MAAAAMEVAVMEEGAPVARATVVAERAEVATEAAVTEEGAAAAMEVAVMDEGATVARATVWRRRGVR
jgi:hypothetical protein